ncbi:helix-turn-helix domain-containing protein [Aquimarina agarivorans]|uniref:helix-turn-helix domain-containing protein n=1 Tax=Aquimarina agarivorans TaxID=980584 RepID=UPI000248F5A3|nr:helix-turn-helix domain-containing protein [Aquimarina agarivorans]
MRKRNEKIEQSNQQTNIIKDKPIININSKEFLSVPETAILLGCSTKTIYRLISKKEINAHNLGTRLTRVKRSEIDKRLANGKEQEPLQYDISECYTISETVDKYGISNGALYNLIKRNEIPKIEKGKYTYIPKKLIDNLLG